MICILLVMLGFNSGFDGAAGLVGQATLLCRREAQNGAVPLLWGARLAAVSGGLGQLLRQN